ncbi:TonB-dependent receptor [Pedobacter sp. PAMC26386]|nr:TonB-dependent receptor [Pedobacter sp. PAMC26386]
MKYSLLIFTVICTFCGTLFASVTMAQKLDRATVTLTITKDKSQQAILKEIEAKTGLHFVYNQDQLSINKQALNETFKNEKVELVLHKLGFECLEKGDYVILKKIPVPVKKTDRTVSGIVKDSTGLTMPGVSVKVSGTTKGTTTNADGKYSISAPEESSLIFSMIGYKTKQVKIDGKEIINIVLVEDNSQLNEVVVVGYGTQKKATISGAVAEVALDKLGSRSVNDIGSILQGKAPGVVVVTESGDPSATAKVNIRGQGGINGESPLYVIDGSLYYGTPVLNPNDIESISVLKDGAAAIYGARASGGVILITTKKGANQKLNITFDAKVGTQTAWKKLKSLNAKEFADVSNLAADNAGIPRKDAFNADKYPDGQITRADWINEIFRTGLIQDYSMGMSGGNDKSSFYLSFNYRKAEGTLLNTYGNRYNFRINSEHRINSWMKVGENFFYDYTNGNGYNSNNSNINGANTRSAYTGTIISAIFYPSSIAPYTETGAFSGLPLAYAGAYGDIINPVAYLKRLDVSNPINTIVANPYAELDLAKGLKFRSNLSLTKTFNNSKSFQTKVPEIGKIFDFNQLTQTSQDTNDLLIEQVLTYDRFFGSHHLNVIGGFSYQKTHREYLNVFAQGFDDEAPKYRYMINATKPFLPVSDVSSQALTSFFARANYDYKSKYLLSLIGRRDGTSLVAQKNRFANYYSASAGWLISREDFLSKTDWISNLKIRASYGLLGNLGSVPSQAVNPPLQQTNIYIGQTPGQLLGYYENVLSNPDLTWAKSKQTNIGLDFGVFKNRLNLVADYFIKDTKDMLIYQPLPGTTGVDGQWTNGGLSRDKGVEIGLNYSNKPEAAFQYSIGATLTKMNNKLVSLPNGLTSRAVDFNVRGTLTPVRLQVGEPLYSYYVVQTDGIFQSDAEAKNYKNASGNMIQPNAKAGDFRFVDANNDGKIDNNDRVFKNSAYPNFSYGFSFNASYKGFDLNLFAQGVQGNKVFNALKYTGLNAGSGQNYNLLNGVLDAWSPTNTGSNLPRISASDANGNFSTTSDFYLESGSYLRLKSATLGYTFSKDLLKTVKISNLRIYLTSNNLFTITKYSGFDPEVGMDDFGVDVGRYPQARTFLFGASLNF